METSPVNTAANLSLTQREAIESMVGRTLESQDMVFVIVMRPGQEPSAADKARARRRLERIFEQSDRYGAEHGIQPDQADAAIDAAVQDVRSRTR
jgi:hypothetical protein